MRLNSIENTDCGQKFFNNWTRKAFKKGRDDGGGDFTGKYFGQQATNL